MFFSNQVVSPTLIPIEYKELKVEDFQEDYHIKNNISKLITPNNFGYITEGLLSEIDIFERNTVVINSGVGQGKTTACIKLAKEYYDLTNTKGFKNHIVFFIAPYINLLSQYQSSLINIGVSQDDVFNYKNLSESNFNEAITKNIHLITVNSLLGNYGDDGFIQKEIKRKYIDSVISECIKNDQKVILIFDEIHDSIKSFQQKFVFNLWRWFPVVHKTFILSATFSESSKIVIKYIADLTEDKIQLIHSHRLKVENKQSNLHLYLNNAYKYTGNDEKICQLIGLECAKGKKVHILTFSETLADSISKPVKNEDGKLSDSKIGEVLRRYFGSINLCTGKSGQLFNENLCNVGTNFKTGTNIALGNTSFIIIAPQNASYDQNFRTFGIFTEGSLSIIQGVARLRNNNNNDIFIVLPTPKLLIRNSSSHLGSQNYLYKLSRIPELKSLKSKERFADFYSMNEQHKLISKFYGSVVGTLYNGFKSFNNYHVHIKSRSKTKPPLDFPTLEEFVMEDGDRFLYNFYNIFGSDLSSYIVWAAFNNQFENTTLKSVYFDDEIILTTGEIIEGLIRIFYTYFGQPESYISEKELYDTFYGFVTNKLIVKVKRKKTTKTLYIRAGNAAEVKTGLITVVKILKRPSPSFIDIIYPNGLMNEDNKPVKAIDYFIDKGQYVRAAITTAINPLATVQSILNENESILLTLYTQFYDQILEFKNNAVFYTDTEEGYIPKKNRILSLNLFSSIFALETIRIIKGIKEYDPFVKDNTFSFFQWVDQINDEDLNNVDNIPNYLSKIVDEFRNLLYVSKTVSISPTTNLRNSDGLVINLNTQPYQIQKEYDLIGADSINLIYSSNSPSSESLIN